MLRTTLAVAVLAVLTPGLAAAQTAWDSPPLVGLGSPAGLSVFLTSPSGGDLGGLATFRHRAGPVGLGYRVGAAGESGTGDVTVSGGIDVSGRLAEGVENSEVDVAWWSGAGIGIGSSTVVSIPVGLLVGWTGSGGDGVLFSPYAGGHVALDLSTADNRTVDLEAAVDLGIDVVLSSGWVVRFGASIGGRDAFAIGIKVPGGGG